MMKTIRLEIADRLRDIISKHGGYKKVSEETGISESTLIRAATGKTDPKLIDIKKIADATHESLHFITYGASPTPESVVLMKEAELNGIIEKQYLLIEKRLNAIEAIFEDPTTTADTLLKMNAEMIEITHQTEMVGSLRPDETPEEKANLDKLFGPRMDNDEFVKSIIKSTSDLNKSK